MTDFFADLERQLRQAHGRHDRGALAVLRGLGPRGATVLRLAAATAVAAAAVGLVTVVLAGAGVEPERDVAAPAPAAACAASTPPDEVTDALGVLRADRQPGDALPRELRDGVDWEAERVARVWTGEARFARNDGERSYWVVPVLLGRSCDGQAAEAPRPGACVLAAAPYLDVPACETVERIAEQGLLLFSAPLDGARWRTSVLVADDATPAIVLDDRRVHGTVERNVFVATYEASHAEQQASRIDVSRQTLHSPDTEPRDAPEDEGWTSYPTTAIECGGSEAPEAITGRFAVLRRRPGPATDYRLDEPDVAHAYGSSGRMIRSTGGLEILVLPVLIGECARGDTTPGICLVPYDMGTDAHCRTLPDDPAEPVVLAVRNANEHGETEVSGIAGDGVERVSVTTPARRLDVEVQAGAFAATVPEPDPAKVTVSPGR